MVMKIVKWNLVVALCNFDYLKEDEIDKSKLATRTTNTNRQKYITVTKISNTWKFNSDMQRNISKCFGGNKGKMTKICLETLAYRASIHDLLRDKCTESFKTCYKSVIES